MQSKLIKILMMLSIIFALPAFAESGINEYDPSSSMFQKITDLEQEKILLQLEKEKAQLNLEMDRMAAEKARIKNEMEEMSNAMESKEKALEEERKRLEIEKQRLDAQRRNTGNAYQPAKQLPPEPEQVPPIQEKYHLIEIVGAGRQLFATIEDEKSGQRKKVSVGKELDGFRVESVSLDDGIVLSKDGQTVTLGIHSGD